MAACAICTIAFGVADFHFRSDAWLCMSAAIHPLYTPPTCGHACACSEDGALTVWAPPSCMRPSDRVAWPCPTHVCTRTMHASHAVTWSHKPAPCWSQACSFAIGMHPHMLALRASTHAPAVPLVLGCPRKGDLKYLKPVPAGCILLHTALALQCCSHGGIPTRGCMHGCTPTPLSNLPVRQLQVVTHLYEQLQGRACRGAHMRMTRAMRLARQPPRRFRGL